MTRTTRFLLSLILFAACANAQATFHLWRMTQFYSNADGSVQYIELVAQAGFQQFISGHTITSRQGATTRSYTFTTNLPGDTANTEGGGYGGSVTTYKSMVIGTQGFAALGVVAPDYVMPNGFLFTTNGTVNFGEGADVFTYASLPTDGRLALYRNGSTAVNSPTNFDGANGTISPAAAALNVQGLWWRSPAASESGWGINITHQGDILFATWFTYDADGSGMWIVMARGEKTATANTWAGKLYRTTGPSFNANPFDPALIVTTEVGTGTFTFTDSDTGSFAYTLNGVTQTKPIMREVFATPVPTCTAGGTHGANVNYQDLWWKAPAASESGWGINITHQGDVIFATWFTYGADGKGMWIVMARGEKTAANTFAGKLYRTAGPAFSAVPFDSNQIVTTEVGTGTFTFTDASTGTFAYTVNGVSQTKAIMREVFTSPASVCK
jgi:hypothetical protein